MSPEDLKRSLQEMLSSQIPLTRAMGLKVEAVSPEVRLSAPLEPNHNHKCTAFGGSLYSAAVLAGWGWLWLWMREKGLLGHVVIQSGQADYLKPVEGAFTAHCQGPEAEDLERFEKALARKGRAKITLCCEVRTGAGVALRYVGIYAVMVSGGK
jgi:thioesterase domain-containing protein